jgi:GNAT superfamily N-acetyltransferase
MTNPHGVAPQIYVRPAGKVDFGYCANLYFGGMETAMRELNLDRDLQKANFRQRWIADEVRIIVRDGKDVGWLQSRIDDNSVFLAQLFVEPACQRQGIGTHIVKRIIDEAARAGRGVTLGVVRTNPAVGLHKRWLPHHARRRAQILHAARSRVLIHLRANSTHSAARQVARQLLDRSAIIGVGVLIH